MASSSRMTAAMTCSCTSALSNVPALGRCVKARRSPTKSWQIAALANLRPTICAPPDERSSRTHVLEIASKQTKGRAHGAAFFIAACFIAPGFGAKASRRGADSRAVHHAARLARTGESEVAQRDPGLGHDIADDWDVYVGDLAVDQVGAADLQ